jgi:F-type H+-transporting ATPase subunit b
MLSPALAFVLPLASSGEGDENILLPAVYDIIWGGLSFLIVFVLFWKYVLPRLRETLEERTELIEGGIARADQMQVEAKQSLEQYQAQLAQARDEAAEIREKAQAEKLVIIEEARREAQAAAEQVTANATAQIEAERAKAVADLRRESGGAAVDLAERIIGDSLDAQRSQAVIDQFIGGLETSATEAGTD